MNIFGNEEEEPQTEDTKVISNSLGIDLGTLNTVIAKPSGDKFDLYQIPSVVAVKKMIRQKYWLLVKKLKKCSVELLRIFLQ